MIADRIVMAAWMYTCFCNTHCKGCINVARALFGEEAGARNLLCFSVYEVVSAGAMKGTSCALRARSFAMRGSSCVCVVLGSFVIGGCRSHCVGCMVHALKILKMLCIGACMKALLGFLFEDRGLERSFFYDLWKFSSMFGYEVLV